MNIISFGGTKKDTSFNNFTSDDVSNCLAPNIMEPTTSGTSEKHTSSFLDDYVNYIPVISLVLQVISLVLFIILITRTK